MPRPICLEHAYMPGTSPGMCPGSARSLKRASGPKWSPTLCPGYARAMPGNGQPTGQLRDQPAAAGPRGPSNQPARVGKPVYEY